MMAAFNDWYDENLKTLLKEHNLHSALEWAWQVAQEAERKKLDDELTAAFMMGYQAAKNDYGRKDG